MKMSSKFSWLMIRRHPWMSAVGVLALAVLCWMSLVLGSIEREIQKTILSAEESKWVVLSFASEPQASAAQQEILKAGFQTAQLLDRKAVIQSLTKLEPQLGQLLTGLGAEADSVVPSIVHVEGKIDASLLQEWQKFSGLLKSEVKNVAHARLQGFYTSLLKKINWAWWGIVLVNLTLLLLMGQVFGTQYFGIAHSLDSWGIPALKIKIPLWTAMLFLLTASWAICFALWLAFVQSMPSSVIFLGDLATYTTTQSVFQGSFFLLILVQLIGISFVSFSQTSRLRVKR